MKKFIVFFLLIGPVFLTVGQTTSFNNQVMLFPIEKPVIVKFNGVQKELNLTWVCNEVIEIEIVTGKICLVTSKGEELIFDSGTKIKITKVDPHNNSFPLNKTSKYLNEPSVYFPGLYSDKRADILVFPIQSGVAKIEHLKFYFENTERIKDATFKLYLKESKKLVWESNDFTKEFESKNIPLITGKQYYWKIYNESNSVKGTFHLLDETEFKKMGLPEKLRKKEDYVNSFFTLLEYKCFFDAIAILLEAGKKYPESELFKTIAAEIPALSTP